MRVHYSLPFRTLVKSSLKGLFKTEMAKQIRSPVGKSKIAVGNHDKISTDFRI